MKYKVQLSTSKNKTRINFPVPLIHGKKNVDITELEEGIVIAIDEEA